MKSIHCYLLEFSYQGKSYQGWLKQPAPTRTIQGVIEEKMSQFFRHQNFKLMAASRTDAHVSSLSTFAKLTLEEGTIANGQDFVNQLNTLLPEDISILKCAETRKDFDIINDPKEKIYHYYFNEKDYPHIDIEIMKLGAKIFEGEHNFRYFAFRPRINQIFKRTIIQSEIFQNEDSYYYLVRSQGFLRHQVRLMMGSLFQLGRGEILLKDLEKQLQGKEKAFRSVPAEGKDLLLYKTICS